MSFFVDGVAVLIPPPLGYEVNFANPTQQHAMIAYVIFGIMFTISTFCFIQYMYVKLRVLREFDTHAALLSLGWIFGVAVQILGVYSFACKIIGVHAWEIPLDKFHLGAYVMVVTPILTALSTGLCKTALALFYYSLSPQRWWQYTSYVSIFIEIGHCVAIFVSTLCACRPFARNWDTTIPGDCIDRPALYVASGALSTFSDLILLIMPIPMVLGLLIPTRQKIVLTIFFAIGSLTLVTAILRLIFLISFLRTLDVSWVLSSTSIVLIAEANLNIVCATLVTLKKFFLHVSPRVVGDESSSDQECGIGGAPFQQNSLVIFGRMGKRKQHDEFGMRLESTVARDRISNMDSANQVDRIENNRPVSFNIQGYKPGCPLPRPVMVSADSLSINLIWDERPNDEMEPERAILQPATLVASPSAMRPRQI